MQQYSRLLVVQYSVLLYLYVYYTLFIPSTEVPFGCAPLAAHRLRPHRLTPLHRFGSHRFEPLWPARMALKKVCSSSYCTQGAGGGSHRAEDQPSQCFLYDECVRNVLPATEKCPLKRSAKNTYFTVSSFTVLKALLH